MTRNAYALGQSQTGTRIKINVDADDYNNLPDLHAGHVPGDVVALVRNGRGEVMEWGKVDCFFYQNNINYMQIQIIGGLNANYVGGCARKEVAKLPIAPTVVETVEPQPRTMADLVYEMTGEDLNSADATDYRQAVAEVIRITTPEQRAVFYATGEVPQLPFTEDDANAVAAMFRD